MPCFTVKGMGAAIALRTPCFRFTLQRLLQPPLTIFERGPFRAAAGESMAFPSMLPPQCFARRSAHEPSAAVFSGPPSHLASPEIFSKSSIFRSRERSISVASVAFIAAVVSMSSIEKRTKSVVPLPDGPSFFV